MHYQTPLYNGKLDPVEKFLKAMGLPEPPVQEMLKITAADLPEETQVILLECKQN